MHKSFLAGGNTHRTQSVEQRLKRRLPRDFTTWGSIPYTIPKPGYYCRCREVHANRKPIWLSPTRLCYSQKIQRWMITVNHWTDHGVLDREIGEGTEGTKDIYSPMGGARVSIGQATRDWTTSQIIHMKEPISPAAYVAEDGLFGCQQEEWLLGLWGFNARV